MRVERNAVIQRRFPLLFKLSVSVCLSALCHPFGAGDPPPKHLSADLVQVGDAVVALVGAGAAAQRGVAIKSCATAESQRGAAGVSSMFRSRPRFRQRRYIGHAGPFCLSFCTLNSHGALRTVVVGRAGLRKAVEAIAPDARVDVHSTAAAGGERVQVRQAACCSTFSAQHSKKAICAASRPAPTHVAHTLLTPKVR